MPVDIPAICFHLPRSPFTPDTMAAPRKLSKAKSAAIVPPASAVWESVGEENCLTRGKFVKFSDVRWDRQAMHGQTRPMSDEVLSQRAEDVRLNPPNECCRTILIPTDVGQTTFWCVAGQHTAMVMADAGKKLLEAGRPVPRWFEGCIGDILKYGTPNHLIQIASGDEQNRQGTVSGMPLSRVLMLALPQSGCPAAPTSRRLLWAIQKSGLPRKATEVCL